MKPEDYMAKGFKGVSIDDWLKDQKTTKQERELLTVDELAADLGVPVKAYRQLRSQAKARAKSAFIQCRMSFLGLTRQQAEKMPKRQDGDEFFQRVAELVLKLKADPVDYVQTQFEGRDPTYLHALAPSFLSTEGAIKIYRRTVGTRSRDKEGNPMTKVDDFRTNLAHKIQHAMRIFYNMTSRVFDSNNVSDADVDVLLLPYFPLDALAKMMITHGHPRVASQCGYKARMQLSKDALLLQAYQMMGYLPQRVLETEYQPTAEDLQEKETPVLNDDPYELP